ncbi:MAG: LysE family translocator [Actinomycetes bacterium]
MRTAVLTFTLAAVLIVLLPGPDTLVVLRSLLRHGRARAALTVVGVLTGLAVWVTAAALGLSALLRASENGYTALRIAGAGYLVWLGVVSLRARRSEGASPLGALRVDGVDVVDVDTDLEPASSDRRVYLSGFGAGLATDLLNPKVGVFFVTFLPGFVPHGEPIGLVSVLLGAIFIVLTAAYFSVLLVLAGRVTGWMNDPRIRRRLDRATGVILIGFGIRLAVES